MKAVFTKAALLCCSVGGNASCGKGMANKEFRPALDDKGIYAVLGGCYNSLSVSEV